MCFVRGENMKKIDAFFLRKLQSNKIEKYKRSNTLTRLMSESRKVLYNVYKFLLNLRSGETASILLSLKSWIDNKGRTNPVHYSPRDIVEVELGLGFGFEMSYRHPCIVVYNSGAGFCLVIPCSTGKFGKRNKYIVDGTTTDGFSENTGVLLDAMRCISKTRIHQKVGEITVPFFNRLNKLLLEEYFSFQYHKLNTNSAQSSSPSTSQNDI